MENRRAIPEINILSYVCVDSTNRILMDLAANGSPVGTVVCARRQYQGRGRLGRSFCSPEGGIYTSFLLPMPEYRSEPGFCLTAMASVAVKRTIFQVCRKKCGIKWVNDVIYNDRKVCGILAQAVGDKVVMGIGVNYTTPMSEFPEELQEIAVSLYEDAKGVPPMEDFVRMLANNLYELCYNPDENWLDEYKGSSTILGNKVQITQAGEVTGTGTAVSIDDLCRLHVVDENGEETVLSTGEVSVRKSND